MCNHQAMTGIEKNKWGRGERVDGAESGTDIDVANVWCCCVRSRDLFTHQSCSKLLAMLGGQLTCDRSISVFKVNNLIL